MINPKVSVIIPVYNAENYMRKCLDSVINQTLKDLEIVCIDDGSTDGSLSVLNEYAKKDNRFVILTQENKGHPKARRAGIDIAKGEYIGFVDADDFIDENYYGLLSKKARKYDADISMTDNVILYDKESASKKLCGVSSRSKVIISNKEKANIIICTGICWNKIYRKSFLDKNNLIFAGTQPGGDNVFNATTIIKSDKIAVVHNAKYYYVQLNTSIVHTKKNRKSFSIVNNYKYINDWIDSQTDMSDYEKRYWKYVNTKRKKYDFRLFYENMEPSCREEFKLLAEENLKIDGLIVSLTSYPERINTVNQAIETILNQTFKAEKVILWLAEEQFPNKEKDLPQQLLDLETKGLTIDWCNDIKSYKKLIPTLKKYPNCVIVTADDDLLYNKEWLEQLYGAYINDPNHIHCHRSHYVKFKHKNLLPYNKWGFNIEANHISFNNFCTSGGGVVYYPNCFYKDILKEDIFMKLCPNADDIWFWAMIVLNNIKINVVTGNQNLKPVDGSQENALYLSNLKGGQNDTQLQNIMKYYPELLEKLDKSNNFLKYKLRRIVSLKKGDIRRIITKLKSKIKNILDKKQEKN